MPVQTFERTRHQYSSQRAEEERVSVENNEVDARLQDEADRYHDIEKSLAEVIDKIDFVLAG